jgi:glycosyltransferase involved in cell wall biosynthesis
MTSTYTILIADCTNHPYNGENIDDKATGGIPLVTTRLAEALAKTGCRVTVRNNTPENLTAQGVIWENRSTPGLAGTQPDFIIACNDVTLFNDYKDMIEKGSIPVLWIHNLFTWKRVFKKGRLKSLFHYKPDAVFLGTYHANQCSSLMPFKSRTIIPHGVDDRFFNTQKSSTPNPPQALFLSKAFRGFNHILDLWMTQIHAQCPDARLKAFIGRNELPSLKFNEQSLINANVDILNRAAQSVVINEITKSTCLIYSGHKDETFCNVAAESTVLGLPIITRGIGSLSERIKNGAGLCATSDGQMVKAIVQCLSDPKTAQNLSIKAAAQRDQYQWKNRTLDWLALFARLKSSPLHT